MSLFNTLHIFGFGTVQVIGDDYNIQCPITEVQLKADAVIDNIWSTKPVDNTSTKEYHAINIFNDMFSDWQAEIQGEKGFRTEYADLDATLINSLATAVINNQPVSAKK